MDAFMDNTEVTEVSSYEDYEHLKVFSNFNKYSFLFPTDLKLLFCFC